MATEVHKIEITPTTLSKLAQALDYRYRIRGGYDEDGADLMDTIGILYKELANNHLEQVYGPDGMVKMAGAPNNEELMDALTTLQQFDMLKLLQKDESHLDGGK